MIKTLSKIKRWLSGHEISDIFFTKKFIYALGVTSAPYRVEIYYTKLGRWFYDAPTIVSALKLYYYIPAWFIWGIANSLWVILELFLPRHIKELL